MLPTPKKIGKYRIDKILGKGAMGVVYQGFDPLIQRTVALKTIHSTLLQGQEGQNLLARFQNEAQAAGRLMHQNIVTIHEYGQEGNIPFIAMEFVQGVELKESIDKESRFDLSMIIRIMEQVFDALDYCHRQGVVHRDLKPANIIILANQQIKIADFGVARMESSTLTQTGTIMGTPSYMSPEQFMGKRVDHRADLFSCGAILFELLTGEKPFPGKSITVIMNRILNAPAENPSQIDVTIPVFFDSVIQKALAKRPDDRFQSAEEFRDALHLHVAKQKTMISPGLLNQQQKGTVLYSVKTPFPNLKRDPFENAEEFEQRINTYPPILIGKGKLLAKNYSTKTGIFPLTIVWRADMKKLTVNFPNNGHIVLKKEAARSLYQSTPEHPLYMRLKSTSGKVTLDRIELYGKGTPHHIVFPSKKKTVTKKSPETGRSWTEPLTNMELLFVAGGYFQMGDLFGNGNNDEKPVHEVSVDDFWIGKYPVTQKAWEAVMEENPSHKKGDHYPVDKVSWNDVQRFIEQLNRKSQKTFRLPTEAEWEYACRSGGKKELYSGGDNVDNMAWYKNNSAFDIHPVGKKAPNGLGLYDMSGNVWEWVEDVYESDSYHKHSYNNPINRSDGRDRVRRGGNWGSGLRDIRSSRRGRWEKNNRYAGLGFRLVMQPL